MNSREAILHRIRKNLSDVRVPPLPEEEAAPTSAANFETFKRVAESVGVEFYASLSDALLGVKTAAISDSPLVKTALAANHEVEAIQGWRDRGALLHADAGISVAQIGIAETGTLVLIGNEEKHRCVSLVPPIHIALLSKEDIVPTLGHALRRLRDNQDKTLSPVVSFITGPSRTADIELQLVLGVHGPKSLRLVLR